MTRNDTMIRAMLAAGPAGAPLIGAGSNDTGSNDTGARPDAADADSIVLSPESRQLLAAWQDWRGDRLLPHRRDMNLVSISRLMPQLALIELYGPDRAVFRLAGTELEQLYGATLTGRSYITMVPPERRRRRGELLWQIATRPCAAVQRSFLDWQSGRHHELELLCLPILPDDPGRPVQVLGIGSRMPQRPWGIREHANDPVTAINSRRIDLIDIGAGLPHI